MEENSEIINRVSQSGIISIDLESMYPQGNRVLFDLKDFLFEELILKEKLFRDHLKNVDWKKFSDEYVAITCTVDAIIPTWAYMLVAAGLQPFAKKITFGTVEKMEEIIFSEVIST